MELQKIIKDISNERFEPYLLSCNGDQKKAFELYEYNIKVSQSFYAQLSALEITLRNKIDDSFKEHFRDDFWLHNVLPPIMGKQVTDLEQKLVQRKKTILPLMKGRTITSTKSHGLNNHIQEARVYQLKNVSSKHEL